MSVYFVQNGGNGLIKIGFTANVMRRFREMQAAIPTAITLMGTLDGSRANERDLHRRFAADRQHGEWFRPSAALLAFVSALPERPHSLAHLEDKARASEHPATVLSSVHANLRFWLENHAEEQLGIRLGTIKKWRERGVPFEYRLDFIDAAALAGIDLDRSIFDAPPRIGRRSLGYRRAA